MRATTSVWLTLAALGTTWSCGTPTSQPDLDPVVRSTGTRLPELINWRVQKLVTRGTGAR